jgi:hypothetical protein
MKAAVPIQNMEREGLAGSFDFEKTSLEGSKYSLKDSTPAKADISPKSPRRNR